MDAQYRTGIDEIDAQHLEIEQVAKAVLDAVSAKDTWHSVHYLVVRLYELLRFHFAVEESLMRIISFPMSAEHKRVHDEILQTIEHMKVATLDPKGEAVGGRLAQEFSFLPHIVDHDRKLADFVVAFGGLTR
ncbi:MAG: hemerythrin domain-containing protein [Sulfuritalea sp.]|nr:hemerythrin domain-containing protein [Sulfuritalea sp.]